MDIVVLLLIIIRTVVLDLIVIVMGAFCSALFRSNIFVFVLATITIAINTFFTLREYDSLLYDSSYVYFIKYDRKISNRFDS